MTISDNVIKRIFDKTLDALNPQEQLILSVALTELADRLETEPKTIVKRYGTDFITDVSTENRRIGIGVIRQATEEEIAEYTSMVRMAYS